jgi:hypothetical protein
MHVPLRIPISCHCYPRSALRLPFLGGFSSSRVVIPVDSLFLRPVISYSALAFSELYKQSSSVTLAILIQLNL